MGETVPAGAYAGDTVGGTWCWNRYPGARCDVESLDYQFAFFDELQRGWTWSELLSPQDDPVGAKRICVDTDYYETFNRENVKLVDVRSKPIERVTARGLLTVDAEHELDCIVFATGFDAMTGPLTSMDIRGRNGVSLAEARQDGPRCYLGSGVAGFPNLFTITGPGSPSVLSNMVLSIEPHVEWIADCLVNLSKDGAEAIEALPDAQDAWVEHVNEAAGNGYEGFDIRGGAS